MYDMEIKAKRMALLNLRKDHPLRKSVSKELRRLISERDGMYDKTKNFKELIEVEDYYSLGRKLEDFFERRGTLKKADASLRKYLLETIKILKYGDPTPESEKITLIRGVKNDRIHGEANGRPFMLPNSINWGRGSWDKRLKKIDSFFRRATEMDGSHGRVPPGADPKNYFDFESIIYHHAASTANSKKSVLISSSATAKSLWGPPFYVLRVSPKRAIFNYKSPFSSEWEVLLPLFVLPNEVVKRYDSYNEVLEDPLVKESPYFKLTKKGNMKEHWKKIEENIRNGRPPLEGISGLDSRYETYNVGPNAEKSLIEKFKAKLKKYGAELEWVSSNDSRLSPNGQARTYVTEDGRIKVLLPKDLAVKKFALMDELTHVIQIHNMSKKFGREAVKALFDAALSGDKAANNLLMEWEIKAKKNILLTLDKNDPNRKYVEEAIKKLDDKIDPFHSARRADGRLDWAKVRSKIANYGAGVAHFTLALFLKELAKAVKSRDRFIIEEFFDGLATTDFYLSYGAFSLGSMGGEMVYTRFLQKYVKPRFVNSVLKSTLVMAAGMALADIAMGEFDGRAYILNLSGMMLSSAAVKAGMSTIKWVIPLEKIASRAPWMAKILKGYKMSKLAKLGGWVFTAAETAVVLYFGDEIGQAMARYLDKREARKKVGEATQSLMEAIKTKDERKIKEALKNFKDQYNGYRNFLYRPLENEEAKLMMRLNALGKEIKGLKDSFNQYMNLYKKNPNKYKSLKDMAEHLRKTKIKALEEKIEDAFTIYDRNRKRLFQEIYKNNLRGTPMVLPTMENLDALAGRGDEEGSMLDRARNWWRKRSLHKAFFNPSENRMETYEDELNLLALALGMTKDKESRRLILDSMEEVRILRETDLQFSKGVLASEKGFSTSSEREKKENIFSEGFLKKIKSMGSSK
ncbi:MAG: hypothetical protein D6785_14400, partial [Planctomycetota bacterium]